MNASQINNYFSQNGYQFFVGTGDQFISFAQRYSINPALIIAIGIQESALGNAYLGNSTALAKKNAYGIMDPSGTR